MPVQLTAKKLSYVDRFRASGIQLLESMISANVVKTGFVDMTFDQGANVVTDAEIQTKHIDLTAADIFAAAAAVAAVEAVLAANGRAHYKALEKMRG